MRQQEEGADSEEEYDEGEGRRGSGAGDDDEGVAGAGAAAAAEAEEAEAFAESKGKWFETGAELTDEDMSFIAEHTKFEPYAVRKHFENFRRECPNGRLTKGHLHRLFKRIFPGGDSEVFCNHIFRIFDSDGNGYLVSSPFANERANGELGLAGMFLFQDFKEFLMALDVTSCRSEREKLQWAFRLYDVDDSGTINLKEIITIMETLDQVAKHIGLRQLLQGCAVAFVAFPRAIFGSFSCV